MKPLFLMAFLCAVFFLLVGCDARKKDKSSLAVNGELDLGHVGFENHGAVPLDGMWTFYRKKLLTPHELKGPNPPEPDGEVKVPGFWPRDEAIGYMTCRLQVHVAPGQEGLAIRVAEVLSAYRLWVNGTLVSTVGHVATSPEDETMDTGITIAPIEDSGERVDILLNISNFSNTAGGVFEPVLIGKEETLRLRDRQRFSCLLLISGGLLIMGIYHLLLYLIRPDERATLFFSLLCLLAGLHHGCDWFLLDTVHLFSKAALFRVDRISFYLSVLMIVLYINAIFPKEAIWLSYPVYIIPAVISSLVVVFTPSFVYSQLQVPYQGLAFLGIFYLAWVVIKALRNKREGSLWLLFGFSALGLAGINDILYVHSLIQTGYFYAVGVLILVLSQAFVLAIRFFKAFHTVERLSGELEEKNIELSRMDKIKDEFLANTSHELRTPLNGIIGIAESIKDGQFGALSDGMKHNLSLITASGRRLAGLVNDILDFSRLRNRDIALNLEPVDIRALTDMILSFSEPMAREKKLVLRNHIPDGLPCVNADIHRLQQILFNLVGNAVKYTPSGDITISAEAHDSQVTIHVSDTGIGIDEANLESIFDAFQQVEGSGTGRLEGTGLGLSITRQLVALHGGTIHVASTPDKGSVFSFTLPVTLKQPEQTPDCLIPNPPVSADPPVLLPRVAVQEKTAGHTGGGSQSVLVVDDDPMNLQIVSNQLSLIEGLHIDTRMNGREAFEVIDRKGPFDLLILDLMMPGISGYDVCRTLRKRYSASELPVILLTGRNQLSDIAEGFACGANDYLCKPFAKEELLARVKIQLHLKDALDAFKENSLLERKLEKATMEMLRYQLNPHFLFNALASIRGAIHEDGDVAEYMVSHLSEFSRLTLSRDTIHKQTVAREIEIVRHFIKMQEIRFEDYLNVSLDIDPGAEHLEIPAMIIQPLVENAIKYGRLTSPDCLRVAVRARLGRPGGLSISVSNTGSWVTPGSNVTQHSTGIGLENIRHRLDVCYHGDFLLDHVEEDGWVRIDIALPSAMPVNRRNELRRPDISGEDLSRCPFAP